MHRSTGLSPPVKYFTDRSKAVLILWIFYVFSVLCLLCLCARLFIVPCAHLLGKGWPLGSRLWCLTVSLILYHWYPGSGVVLGCIDSWSLHPYLLCLTTKPCMVEVFTSNCQLMLSEFNIGFCTQPCRWHASNMFAYDITSLSEIMWSHRSLGKLSRFFQTGSFHQNRLNHCDFISFSARTIKSIGKLIF